MALVDAQILVWNSAAGFWENKSLSADLTMTAAGVVTVAGTHAGTAHHAEAHSIASHSDTTATGAELEELTDGSETTLHSHAGGAGHVIEEDGTPLTARANLNFVEGIIATDNDPDTDVDLAWAGVGDIADIAAAEVAGTAVTVPRGDHVHAHPAALGADLHHAESHTIASHSDTTATGAELETLTDGSNADALHVHAGIGNPLRVGTADTTAGTLIASGAAAASTQGGLLQLEMAADHDTTDNSWDLEVFEDDLQFNLSATGTRVTFTQGGDIVIGAVGGLVDGVDVGAHPGLPDIHHTEVHTIASTGPHAQSGLTAGDVLRASSTTAFDFATLAHGDLSDAPTDAHHTEAHVVDSSGPHTGAGLTIGHMLRASSTTAFAFAAIADGDVPGTHAGSAHHAESHTIASHSDTTATGAELETLTDGSNADALHVHAAGAPSNPLRVGTADTTAGTLIASGAAAASTQGGLLQLEMAADHDTTDNSWDIEVIEDDLLFSLSASGEFARMTAIASNLAVFSIGQEDVVRGELQLFGDATGQAGTLKLYNAADFDTTNNWWQIYSFQDAIFMGPDGDGDQFWFKANGDLELLNGDLTTGADVNFGADVTLGRPAGIANRLDLATGDVLRLVGSSGDFGGTLADGILNYRTDTDELRLRANGAWVSLATGNVPIIIRKATTETVNNSATFQDDDELIVPVLANTDYVIEWFLIVEGDASLDFKFQFSEPTSCTWNARVVQVNTSGTLTYSVMSESTPVGLAVGLGGGTIEDLITVTMQVTVEGAAGNITLRWAANGIDTVDTDVKAGSFVRHQKV